jgi:diguanylate cyclase (GGDEF)-like protein/hemerythrin-like metal-binding protein/PAS domain S-box-containing protein
MNFTELYFKAIFAETPTALSFQKIILDDKGVPCDYEYIAINPALEKLFQVKAADVVGKKFSEIYPVVNERTAKWIKTVGKVALNENIISEDIEISIIQKRLRITLFSLDKYYCAARYVEITEDKWQQDQLSQLFEVDLDMLCVSDLDGNFIKVNKEFKNVLGYEAKEFEGLNITNFVHAEDVDALLAAFKMLETQKTLSSFVNRIRHKDGSCRYLEWRSRVHGEYIYSSARDITERTLMEIKLRQTNKELVNLTQKLREANEMLKSLAITDELTGLYNRHFFDRKTEEEMGQADRDNAPLSLIVFDLDHFKKVNDTWGHPVGDEVLKITTKVVGGQIRGTDVLCRIGGEEFAVILPQTTLPIAVMVAERLREALDADLHPKVGKVTGSFGVAERIKAESFRHWYKRADDALYLAKNQSRNCVVANSESERSIATVRLGWREEWSSGNTTIDEQHREILEKSSSLITLLYSQAQPEKILGQLDNLLTFIISHFKNEEQIIGELGYPDTEQHVQIHETLVAKTLNFKTCFLKRELQATAFFSFIIDEVVLEHMIKEDVKFFPYLKEG